MMTDAMITDDKSVMTDDMAADDKPMTPDAIVPDDMVTCSPWYDGSLTLWQPRQGLRATTDSVLVAAAVDGGCQRVAELGAGAGAASLALARRCPQAHITAIERDPLMVALLHRNIGENRLTERITALEADINDAPRLAHLAGRYDHVFFNPPYNDEASSLSGDALRRTAMAGDDPAPWVEAAARLLVARGGMTLISRSERLDAILAAAHAARFGDIVVRAVHARPDKPALRVLVSARKGVRGGLVLLPPLVMRDAANTLTPAMDAISHELAAIDMHAPGRKRRRPALPDTAPDDSPSNRLNRADKF